MNAGKHTLEWLYSQQLQIDDEWSEPTSRGFRWWAGHHAQTIEMVPEESHPDEEPGAWISVRTELLRNVTITPERARFLNRTLMPMATMAGPVFDAEKQTLELASRIRVSEQVANWLNPLISTAAALQLVEARITATKLASKWNVEESVSGPAGRGTREQPDELLWIDQSLLIPHGKEPSRWGQEEFDHTVEAYMQQPPAVMASGGGPALTVEFPFGEMTSLCRFRAEEPHPHLGSGLQLLQSFPLDGVTAETGPQLALEFNHGELLQETNGYGFGSYTWEEGVIHFTTFIPNAAYRPGLLPNLFYAAATRAEALSLQLTGTEWTPEVFEQSLQNKLEIMAQMFGLGEE